MAYLSTLLISIFAPSRVIASSLTKALFLRPAQASAYAVLVNTKQVLEAEANDVVVDTEVEVEDETNKNLGCLKNMINKKNIFRIKILNI